MRKDPRLPFLDAIEPVTIRDSRWRCDHGWDIDLDDGSSNYVIDNNLLLAGGLKFREGYHRKASNNILVNNGFHPHVWFDKSDSEFRHNIEMRPHAPIGQPAGWGGMVNENLFLTEADRVRHLDSGGDSRSAGGDPMFMDPAAGDFRVKDGSPALKIGFRNFPMDQFGVKKPALKVLAKTPVFPALKTPAAESSTPGKEPRMFWLGAPLHSLTGEEFSAFGVSRDDMGVQLVEVTADSPAASAGSKTNDLIQAVNGVKVSHTDHLFAALLAAAPGKLKLRVVRNQQPIELAVDPGVQILAETAADADSLRRLPVLQAREMKLTSSEPTVNEPLATLADGKLVKNYGPVFGNDLRKDAYKIDLGSRLPVAAVNAWSFNQNGKRGSQRFTVYGSASAGDPGWDTKDAARFVPLGSIDTRSLARSAFTASSLRASTKGMLGDFRWVLIETHPVTGLHENTAWQEFQVESGH